MLAMLGPEKVSAMGRRIGIRVAAMTLALAACATTQRPVLYPNAYLRSVGDAAAQRDIDQCLQLADNSGLAKSNNQVARHGAEGAAVGAAAGSVGTLVSGGNVGTGAAAGAAIGAAAGAVHGAFRNDANPTYRNFAQRCLQDRGYDVIGWQ
jgi:outer membrane lipoprotein SlyB